MLVATFFMSVCVAEISFPESILTFTDQEWLIDLWPKAYRYNIQVGLCALIVPAFKIQKDFAIRALETLCRIGIGGMFIFASIFKIQNPHEFAVLVAQYQFFPALHLEFLNNFFALVYPQFELWFGLAMIVSPFVRESALAIFWMFVSFIIALGWALYHDPLACHTQEQEPDFYLEGFQVINTSLCYIEQDGKYLLLHRIKKKNDINKDKWIGIGGKFEENESPEDCIIREAREETGLTIVPKYRGIVTFISDGMNETEFMHLFTSKEFSGTVRECDEGVLEWVPKEDVIKLPHWDGDMIFLSLLNQDVPFFSLKLTYRGSTLVEAILDGKNVDYRDFI